MLSSIVGAMSAFLPSALAAEDCDASASGTCAGSDSPGAASQQQDQAAAPQQEQAIARDMEVIAYEELEAAMQSPNPSVFNRIVKAYGYAGLGILAVSNVPDMAVLRQRLLPLSREFAVLPDAVKAATERPDAYFQVGWSYGNEKLQGDQVDWAKGSYYANPLADVPEPSDAEMVKKYPSFLEPNVWPGEALPDFEPAFKDLGVRIVEVGRLVAKQCDDYIESVIPGYENGRFFKLLTESKTAKGRLLHYYPVDEVAHLMPAATADSREGDSDFSDWCGWHNDHGSLTGLVPAMYLDKNGQEVANPDKDSGLYVRSRKGELIKVNVPKGSKDVLLFQIGETAQVHSGGLLQATPHAVRGALGDGARGVSRDTFAVFMEPEYNGDMSLPPGRTVEEVQSGEAVKYLPVSVKTLGSRWKKGMDFGEFSEATFSTFY
jgi:isopenicillin N synthase-like dioxygenase